jgi:two-component system CheB/CheR fusion protein
MYGRDPVDSATVSFQSASVSAENSAAGVNNPGAPYEASVPATDSSSSAHASVARLLAPVLVALVFWVHLSAPTVVAISGLYVVPILLFIRTGRFWEPLLVAVGSSAATIAAPLVARSAPGVGLDPVTLPLELATIWLCAGAVAYHRVVHDRWNRDVAVKQSTLEATVVRLEALRYALDQAAIVAVTDQRGVITYANDKFCEISKYAREELLGQDHRLVNSGYHSAEFIRTLWRTIAQGQVWRGEIRNRAKDGTVYWVDTTIVPLLDERGKPRQYLAIRSDITQRKAAEAKLVEQSALTQLGQLAAVVAHEVRNPLAGLRGALEVLRARLELSARDRQILQVMIERIDTLNAKVSDILRFARPESPMLQSVEIVPIISETIAAARAAVGPEAPVIASLADPIPVRADPDMLRAALLNLLLNACQAGSTRVEVRTSAHVDVCRIEILDDGKGIPEDVLPHMFEAFYTTKKTGTGLGLPIVKRLATLQGGTVTVKPREEAGTVAELTLPVAAE